MHGANRLASNSLLEGLVFGTDAATLLTSRGRPEPIDRSALDLGAYSGESVSGNRTAIDAAVDAIQRVMSRDVAVVRSADGLRTAAADVERQVAILAQAAGNDRFAIEAQNIADAASQVIGAALFREESRGAHFREDFPETIPALDGRHSLLFGGASGRWRFGALSEAFAGTPVALESGSQ
ncbi:MAG: hypothetical protein M9947_03365 [Thermomicrobiales bacterium]|nr:hypothetical protein [Thermomicrobiales bacterium]